MGTTLTGTKPKDTYDSLIKVEDNGPISGTAKYLSDGLGNNLPIAVSTSNVGIGTSAPNVSGYSRALTISSANSAIELTSATNVVQATIASSAQGLAVEGIGTAGIRFFTSTSGATTERVRITDNGLTFNGDTAAANALDDYEEGTFTATVAPNVSGTITVSVNTCTYTKIGRQVTIKGQLVVGSVASPVGTAIAIGGLPFTSINSVAGRGAGSVTYFPAVGSGSTPANYQLQNAVEWSLVFTASTIAAGDEFYITLTYFV